VAFGPLNLGLTPDEARGRVAEALGAVGLAGAGDRVPFQLSGGEKRRAALAGVLAMRPAVLLLDEPSMFLDPRSRRELIGVIRGLPGTKLIATHDLDLVLDTCPRVLVLDGGRLAPTARRRSCSPTPTDGEVRAGGAVPAAVNAGQSLDRINRMTRIGRQEGVTSVFEILFILFILSKLCPASVFGTGFRESDRRFCVIY
jgi:energy-coupling factor transporter ATP-binding protein EcfA2